MAVRPEFAPQDVIVYIHSSMGASVDHIAITTADLDGCRAFWETVFQAQPIERPKAGVGSEGLWFQIGELELHLMYRQKPRQKTDQHFALVVENADELADRARRMGRQVETRENLPGYTNRYYLYDPDGNRVEIFQRVK